MLIIVGLGNPGSEYCRTFHNAGFLVLDRLIEKLNINLKTRECKAQTGKYFKNSEKIVIAKPQTFMNLSGLSVRELIGKYKADLADLLIVYDDIDIPIGTLRIRKEGSPGTHNGMKDIFFRVGNLPRLRVGIKKETDMFIRDYVLSSISDTDMNLLDKGITKAVNAIIEYINNRNLENIMMKYNTVRE